MSTTHIIARAALAAALSLALLPVSAQELSIGLIERTPAGEYVTAATVSVPMASDDAARRAAGAMRMWIANESTIKAATIIPMGADGLPMGEATANTQGAN